MNRTVLARFVIGLLLYAYPVAWATEVAPSSEPGLEPEFRLLRERLGSQPEFTGTDAASKFRLAEELAHRGDVFGAIAAYRASIAANPDRPETYRGLGQVLLDHHDYKPAAEAFQTSIRLGLEDAQVNYWLGRAFMGQNELRAAAEALNRASELGDDAEVLADLGLVKMAQGDMTGAEKTLDRSIRLKPDYSEAHRFRDLLMKNRQDPESVRRAAQAILSELFAKP